MQDLMWSVWKGYCFIYTFTPAVKVHCRYSERIYAFFQGLEGMDASSVREAIKTWQDNYIHVQAVMDEFVTLRERTKYLRDEVGNCTRRSVITNDSLQLKKVRK